MKKTKKTKSEPPHEIKKIIGRVRKSFFETMRRPPAESDRVFYWSYCYSEAEFKDEMIRIMIQAKIPQHLIYIYDKTGFMVSEAGYNRLSKDERKEIEDAAVEYESLEESNSKIYKAEDYSDGIGTHDNDPLVQALYILGNFVERNVNEGRRKIDVQNFVCAYLTVRAYRIVRAVFRAQRYTTSEESLVLVRSLYEIYCKLTYALHSQDNSNYLLDSDFGLINGEYEFANKDGKLKRHILVNKKTRKEIPRTRSFYDFIQTSPIQEDLELFEVLYEYLSSFVHSGSRHIFNAWKNSRDGFKLTNDRGEDFTVFVAMLTCLISAMIMQALLRLRKISNISRWDICLFCYATKGILSEVATPKNSEIFKLFPKIKARAARLPKSRHWKLLMKDLDYNRS